MLPEPAIRLMASVRKERQGLWITPSELPFTDFNEVGLSSGMGPLRDHYALFLQIASFAGIFLNGRLPDFLNKIYAQAGMAL